MKTCPYCRLANPDGAPRCDCGYNFETQRFPPIQPDSPAKQKRAQRKFIGTVIMFGFCLVLWFAPAHILKDNRVAMPLLLAVVVTYFCAFVPWGKSDSPVEQKRARRQIIGSVILLGLGCCAIFWLAPASKLKDDRIAIPLALAVMAIYFWAFLPWDKYSSSNSTDHSR
jgi:hypothetical protein